MKKTGIKIISCVLVMALLFTSSNIYAGQQDRKVSRHFNTEDNGTLPVADRHGESKRKIDRCDNGITRIAVDTFIDEEQEKGKLVENHKTDITYTVDVSSDGQQEGEEVGWGLDCLKPMVCYARNGSNYVEDDACGWKILCSTTVYWSTTVSKGITYIGITKVVAKVQSLNGYTGAYQGGGVSLKAGSVSVGQNGFGMKAFQTKQKKVYNTPAKPYSKTYKISSLGWDKVSTTAGVTCVNVVQKVNYTVNGASCSLTFNNDLVVDGSAMI